MGNRKGEKLGWTLGWCGGFFWVLILSILFFFQSKIFEGIIGIAIVLMAISVIFFFAPWKKPSAKFWKLSMFPYSVFLISIVWAIWSY
ncbi:MAG: hypothetical protein N2445_03290, partial [Acidobacteria bacterium]|nr:hypothetical protein [Acidobacteriota bacterium]